jgi:hypothetical protein
MIEGYWKFINTHFSSISQGEGFSCPLNFNYGNDDGNSYGNSTVQNTVDMCNWGRAMGCRDRSKYERVQKIMNKK